MIDKLKTDFVNTWIIISQFKNPEKFFDDENARSWANVIADEFTYPVDSIILSAEGKPIDQLEYGRARTTRDYLKFIDVESHAKQ